VNALPFSTRASLVYLVVPALAALATPVLGDPGYSAVVWIGGAVVLMALLVRRAFAAGQPHPIGGISVAVLVGVIAAFFAFVVMVNIWERIGIAH
jgi:hypothetical protein